MSVEMSNTLTSWFKGLKRTVAERQARGEGKIVEGKSAMEFSLFAFLAGQFMKVSWIQLV